jgi:hypothetical protein
MVDQAGVPDAPQEVDASWWSDAATAMGDTADLGQPELWFSELAAAARQAPEGSLQQQVLQALATSTSAMLVAGNWSEPFEPAMRWEGRRSLVPADLTDDQLELLARVAPLIEHTTLRARIADVCWTYGDRRRVDLLHLAADAYRAVPLDSHTWFTVGEESWTRALELILRRGTAERDRAREMTEELAGRLLTTTTADAFMTVKLSELLRSLRSRLRPDPLEVSTHLSTLAAEVTERNRRLARHLDDEARAWCVFAGDQDAAWAAQARIAESYVAEAADRSSGDDSGAFVAGTLYEQAIARLMQIPRARRASTGLDDRVDELRRKLTATRRLSLEMMTAVESEPVDLTTSAQQARRQVSGHERFEALARFCALLPLTDVLTATAAAREQLKESLSRLFSRTTLASDGRKVAAGGGVGDMEDDVDAALVRDFGIRVEMSAVGVLMPAMEVLQAEHRFTLDTLQHLCLDSPTVPAAHVDLWARGLYHGLNGDFPSAIALLVPQLEQLVRLQLRAAGAYTLVVDLDTGVESEKGLGALLGMPEATAVLGESMAFELRALLVEQQGANLRNHVAHGLLTDGQAWSAYALYAWWLALRLAVVPVWLSRMPQTDPSAGSQPVDPPEGAEQEGPAQPDKLEPLGEAEPPTSPESPATSADFSVYGPPPAGAARERQ